AWPVSTAFWPWAASKGNRTKADRRPKTLRVRFMGPLGDGVEIAAGKRGASKPLNSRKLQTLFKTKPRGAISPRVRCARGEAPAASLRGSKPKGGGEARYLTSDARW